MPSDEAVARVLAAWVSRPDFDLSTSAGQLRALAKQTRDALRGQASEGPVDRSAAVGDHSVHCLLCGWTGRLLKVHLSRRHQIGPAEYRRLHDLPDNFPLVAPDLSASRRIKFSEARVWLRRRPGGKS